MPYLSPAIYSFGAVVSLWGVVSWAAGLVWYEGVIWFETKRTYIFAICLDCATANLLQSGDTSSVCCAGCAFATPHRNANAGNEHMEILICCNL